MTANVANLPVATSVPARLPMPAGMVARGITAEKWRVLVETTYPSARTPEAVEMAIDYCRARNLDPFKKPVHIVPMWNSTLRKEVETIWPGINEVQITASRTNAWAGMDSPKWGPMIRRTFKGNRKVDGAWKTVSVEVHFPEWCEVTVYRIVGGQPRAFSEPVFWVEAYSTTGGKDSELPTDMWVKRPHGQLHKVAKAAALRAAFPEEGEYTAEEMEGKVIDAGGIVIEHEAAPAEAPMPVAKPPIKVKVPGQADALFPQDDGLDAALEAAMAFMSDGINERRTDVVGANVALLDRIIAKLPHLADEVAELRAAAAMQDMINAEQAEEPDTFVRDFVNGDDIDDGFPGTLPPK